MEKRICNQFKNGCSIIYPGCDTVFVRITDDKFGYRPISCTKDCICGFFPVYDRDTWYHLWGDRNLPFPLDALHA